MGKIKTIEAKTDIEKFSEKTEGDVYSATIRRQFDYPDFWLCTKVFLKWATIGLAVGWVAWGLLFIDMSTWITGALFVGLIAGFLQNRGGWWHEIKINDTQIILNDEAYGFENLGDFVVCGRGPLSHNIIADYGKGSCFIKIDREFFEADLLRKKLNAEIAKRTGKLDPVNVPINDPDITRRAAGF